MGSSLLAAAVPGTTNWLMGRPSKSPAPALAAAAATGVSDRPRFLVRREEGLSLAPPAAAAAAACDEAGSRGGGAANGSAGTAAGTAGTGAKAARPTAGAAGGGVGLGFLALGAAAATAGAGDAGGGAAAAAAAGAGAGLAWPLVPPNPPPSTPWCRNGQRAPDWQPFFLLKNEHTLVVAFAALAAAGGVDIGGIGWKTGGGGPAAAGMTAGAGVAAVSIRQHIGDL